MRRFCVYLLLAVLLLSPLAAAAEESAVVRAILFYSPSCPACHEVLGNSLPPIAQHYGDRLQVVLIDVTGARGQALYRAARTWVSNPDDMYGVPAMIVGRELLVGSYDIPNRLPGIIDQGLAQGGIDWPDIAGLADALIQAGLLPAEVPTAQPTAAAQPTPAPVAETIVVATGAEAIAAAAERSAAELSVAERVALDPTGSAIAIAVLALMLISLAVIGVRWARGNVSAPAAGWQRWTIPLLALVGLGVAAYLAYVETTDTPAVCGPVGDCNVVQQSPYARLFGVLPIGVLGVAGYVIILALWAWQQLSASTLAVRGRWLLPAVVFTGVVFSAYLTFLEPFVIGAVCMWCVSSAVIMTLLLWAVYLWMAGEPSRSERRI